VCYLFKDILFIGNKSVAILAQGQGFHLKLAPFRSQHVFPFFCGSSRSCSSRSSLLFCAARQHRTRLLLVSQQRSLAAIYAVLSSIMYGKGKGSGRFLQGNAASAAKTSQKGDFTRAQLVRELNCLAHEPLIYDAMSDRECSRAIDNALRFTAGHTVQCLEDMDSLRKTTERLRSDQSYSGVEARQLGDRMKGIETSVHELFKRGAQSSAPSSDAAEWLATQPLVVQQQQQTIEALTARVAKFEDTLGKMGSILQE
jgi:hypothetical protein